MSISGAALGGAAALGFTSAVSFISNVLSHSMKVLNCSSTLSAACQESLLSAVSRCGCDELTSGTEIPARTKRVYLCAFLTYTVPKNNWLPSWSWTTHWAIEVDGTYYELCRDRSYPLAENRYKLEHRTWAERTRYGQKERHHDLLRMLMGVTHLSDEQLIQIGETHASNYRWDPLIHNCQTFLHEAYFGKPLFRPLGKKKEIRCPEHGPLRPIPAFTMLVLGTSFASVYLVEQGIEWTFGLALSPATLILRAVPMLIGTAYFIPASYGTVKSYWKGHQDSGRNSTISSRAAGTPTQSA